jgi:hypothetical protein
LAAKSAPNGTHGVGRPSLVDNSSAPTVTPSWITDIAAAHHERPAKWSRRRTWSCTGDTAVHRKLLVASAINTVSDVPALPATAARTPIADTPMDGRDPNRRDWSSRRRRRRPSYGRDAISAGEKNSCVGKTAAMAKAVKNNA